MKKITTSIAAAMTIVSLLLTNGNAFAQSKSLPISSVGSAVSYSLLRIRNIQGSLSAPSMLQSNGLTTSFSIPYNPQGVPDKNKIAAAIRAQLLSYRLANPSNDTININLSYNSGDGDLLFQGNKGFRLERNANGTWKMPAGAANLQSYLSSSLAIYEPGALGATIILRDGQGNAIQYVGVNVQYDNSTGLGKISFPTAYLGQHGETIVYYAQKDQYGSITNTYSAAFDMDTDGSIITPVSGSMSIESGFGQLVELNPPYANLTDVESYNHTGVSPLVQITIKEAQWVNFSASTTESEQAIGFTLKKLEIGKDNTPIEYKMPPGIPYVPVYLEPGVYHVDYRWSKFAPAQILPWYYYGGKEGTTVPVVGGGMG